MKVGFVRKYKVKVGDKLLLACETLGIQGHLMHEFIHDNNCCIKVLIHVEMPKAAPKKSICHFQKLEMILKCNKQNTVRLPQKYRFVLIKHKINC